MRAADCRRDGLTIDETYVLLRSLRHKMAQIFTVGDLRYLRRTGRLSNIEAAVGTVLQIKPLLKGDPQGKIVCFSKVRGRQRAVEAIAACYTAHVVDAQNQIIGIAHADCEPDAQILASLLRRSAHPPKDILLVDYEPVTGSHVGPGALALFSCRTRTSAISESITAQKLPREPCSLYGSFLHKTSCMRVAPRKHANAGA